MKKDKNRKDRRIRREPKVLKYTLISIAVFLAAVGMSIATNLLLKKVGFTSNQADHIASVIEGIIAAIATGLVLFQLKDTKNEQARENDIEEARFLLQANQIFLQDKNMSYVQDRIEQRIFYHPNKQFEDELITDDNIQLFINYLVYLEGLVPLVLKDILRLDSIDDLMGYRFFLAVNNPDVQEKCLYKYPEYYMGCFKVYKKWRDYRVEKFRKYKLDETKAIMQKETQLDRLEMVEKYDLKQYFD